MFILHYWMLNFLEISIQKALLLESYAGIFFFGLLLMWGMMKAFNKYSHLVAWLYMLGSLIKFGLFFLLLWPLFKADGTLTIIEKSSFLVPYILAQSLETYLLVQKLNKI